MWSVQEKTGWTDHYILWGISLANLRMKLADGLRYTTGEKVIEIENFDDLEIRCDV